MIIYCENSEERIKMEWNGYAHIHALYKTKQESDNLCEKLNITMKQGKVITFKLSELIK